MSRLQLSNLSDCMARCDHQPRDTDRWIPFPAAAPAAGFVSQHLASPNEWVCVIALTAESTTAQPFTPPLFSIQMRWKSKAIRRTTMGVTFVPIAVRRFLLKRDPRSKFIWEHWISPISSNRIMNCGPPIAKTGCQLSPIRCVSWAIRLSRQKNSASYKQKSQQNDLRAFLLTVLEREAYSDF